MSKRVTSVRNIKTIKAYRGEALTINLGKEYAGGTLTAWMKKSPNASTYREFSIGLTNGTIELSKEKASDYYNSSGVLIEAIEGRWYFDVEFIADGASSETVETVVSGTILFINDITNSNGYEIADPQTGLVTDSLRIQISEEQNLDNYLLNGLFRFGDTIPNISSLTFTKADGSSSDLEQLISGTSISEILIEIRKYDTIEDDFLMVTQHMTTNTQNQVYTRSYSGDANMWSDWALLTNVGSAVSNTSDLVNDGSDGTSTYVENDELGSVATSNNYNDLDNKPTEITKTSDLTNDGADGTSTFVESDELPPVATSGDYDDLTNKPTISGGETIYSSMGFQTDMTLNTWYSQQLSTVNSSTNFMNGTYNKALGTGTGPSRTLTNHRDTPSLNVVGMTNLTQAHISWDRLRSGSKTFEILIKSYDFSTSVGNETNEQELVSQVFNTQGLDADYQALSLSLTINSHTLSADSIIQVFFRCTAGTGFNRIYGGLLKLKFN
jgi:hypothetical protein